MAVIGTIRKQSTFLIIIIGVALLAFVLGDFVKSGPSGGRNINVGIVDGEEITIMEFNRKVEQNEAATRQQQDKERLSPAEVYRLKNDTWNQMVSDIIYDKEYETLGINVTPKELFDLIQGPNPHPLVQQSFANPETGQFDRNLVVQFLQNVNADQVRPDIKQQWIVFENYIKQDRLKAKYNTLISNGYYVPKAFAKLAFEEDNNKADFSYVAKAYKDVPDSLVNDTDEVYEAYYEKNKEEYKEDAYRDFDYVVFDIVASAKDIQDARNEMDKLQDAFEKTNDVKRFVLVNSDIPYDSSWKTEGQLPVQIDSLMFDSEIGTVANNYMLNNTFFLSRLTDIAYRPDSMKATHILISYAGALRADPSLTRTKTQAESLADSLLAVVEKSSNKIDALAPEFSDDPSAQTNNGDLDWFADGMMVPAFNEAVINTKVNGVTMAETPFGYHIIKVTGKKDEIKKVKVATIVREVLISNDTYQQIYAKASKLASETSSIDEFNAAINEDRLSKRVAPKVHAMDNTIPGLMNPRQIVLWAFDENREVGDVSQEVFDLDGQFVVAVLTGKSDESYPPLEEVKVRLRPKVINELKGEYILQEMEAMGNNMETMKNTPGFSTDDIAAQTYSATNLKGFGAENKVIGTVFGIADGSVFGPIVGLNAVFVGKLNRLIKAAPQDSYTESADRLVSAFQNRVSKGSAYRALEASSEIEDFRATFY